MCTTVGNEACAFKRQHLWMFRSEIWALDTTETLLYRYLSLFKKDRPNSEFGHEKKEPLTEHLDVSFQKLHYVKVLSFEIVH